MSQQKNPRLYWKDALRRVQVNLTDETLAARQQQWHHAFRQARADLADPGAVVWLPDEIADLLNSDATNASPASATSTLKKRQRLVALLVTLVLLIPILISYLLAYRRISPHLR